MRQRSRRALARRASRTPGAALLVSLAGENAEWVEPREPAASGALARFRQGLGAPRPPPRAPGFRPISGVGAAVIDTLHGLRETLAFLGETTLALLRLLPRPWGLRWAEVLRHLDEGGPRAVLPCILLGTLIGVILAFQSSIPMRKFGAEIFIPQLVGIALTRELGPLLAGVVLAGRTGSAFAAELGTMRVNQEVDALKVMGLDPVAWLVQPRVVAAMLAMLVMPALALVMNLTGLLGMGIVMATLGFPPPTVLAQPDPITSAGLDALILSLARETGLCCATCAAPRPICATRRRRCAAPPPRPCSARRRRQGRGGEGAAPGSRCLLPCPRP